MSKEITIKVEDQTVKKEKMKSSCLCLTRCIIMQTIVYVICGLVFVSGFIIIQLSNFFFEVCGIFFFLIIRKD